MLLAFLLAAAPVCTTRCGMTMNTTDCRGLQEMESRALAAFERAGVWPYAQSCGALKGWTVHARPRVALDGMHCKGRGFWMTFDQTDGACLDGYTWLETRTMDVVRVPWWGDHPLPHEMAHAIDLTLGGLGGHCRWTPRGIKRALREATGYVDRTVELCRFACY